MKQENLDKKISNYESNRSNIENVAMVGSVALLTGMGSMIGYEIAQETPNMIHEFGTLYGALSGLATGACANLKWLYETEKFSEEQAKKQK